MVQTPWRQPPLTQEEANDLFMLMLEDDTEDAPWLVMGDLQFWSASSFAHSLRIYAHERGLDWYVASMLPIEYEWPKTARKKQLAPDTFVAFVAERARTTFDVAAEGAFPPFVLEVVSPSSTTRDQQDKRLAYDLLGRRNTPYSRRAKGRARRWKSTDEARRASSSPGRPTSRGGCGARCSDSIRWCAGRCSRR
jgi:hypothetical protein